MPKLTHHSTSVNNAAQGYTMLDLALWYAAQGMAVFPLKPGTKDGPLIKAWQKNATCDETQIRDWWSRWPNANIGGHPSAGQVVLDVDGPEHGEVNGQEHEGADGFESVEGRELPETLKALSGSGGEHHWYSLPGGEEDWAQYKTTKTGVLPGVDLRGVKGYVVMPGSVHPNGKPYKLYVDGEAVDPRTLDGLSALRSISEAPGWLLDLCRGTNTERTTKDSGTAKETLQELLANPPEEGGRNDWLTRVAGHYAHKYAQDRDKYDRCLEDAGNKTKPPMDADEVVRVGESIWAAEQDRRRNEVARVEDEGRLAPPPGNPVAVVRWLVPRYWEKDGLPTLVRWNGDFYRWRGDWWEVCPEETLAAIVTAALEHAEFLTPKGDLCPWAPTRSKVGEVLYAMQNTLQVNVNADNGREWIATPTCDAEAIDLLPVANGLLNLRTGELVPSTPALFCTWGTPYAFDPQAQAPHWLDFVGRVYEPSTRKALQEWFGYLLSGETRMQKMFWLWGAPGSGKGTTHRILERLLGSDFANTTVGAEIGDLRTEFGAMHWPGKSLVTFTDSASGLYAGGLGLARLKSFTGGDRVSINRKNSGYWQGVPSFRLMFLSNEPPAWSGDAKPMVRRLVVGRTTGERVEGDTDLETQFVAELPGVLNWALEGLKRLRETGEFSEPETQADDLESMTHSGLTVSEFFNECFVDAKNPDGTSTYTNAEVYARFKDWWDAEGGHTKPLNSHAFYSEVKALNDPNIITAYVKENGKRVRKVSVVGRLMERTPQPAYWG